MSTNACRRLRFRHSQYSNVCTNACRRSRFRHSQYSNVCTNACRRSSFRHRNITMRVPVHAKVFGTVSVRGVISLEYINLTLKQHYDLRLEALEHHMKCHPDQLTSTRENDPNRFSLSADLMTLNQGQGHSKWYESIWLKLCTQCHSLKSLVRKMDKQTKSSWSPDRMDEYD